MTKGTESRYSMKQQHTQQADTRRQLGGVVRSCTGYSRKHLPDCGLGFVCTGPELAGVNILEQVAIESRQPWTPARTSIVSIVSALCQSTAEAINSKLNLPA